MKVLVAVTLAVLLTVAFAVPVFADKGGNPNANADDKALGSAYGQDVSAYAKGDKPFPGDVNPGQWRSSLAGQRHGDPGLADDVHAYKDSLR